MAVSSLSAKGPLNTYSYEFLVKGVGTKIVGDFFYDGEVYATTNELEHGKVIDALKKQPALAI